MSGIFSRIGDGREVEMMLSFPLDWPQGRARHCERYAGDYKHPLTALASNEVNDALRRLKAQIHATGGISSFDVSSNRRLRWVGTKEVEFVDPAEVLHDDDPGVVVSFYYQGEKFALSSDAWTSVANNVAVVAAHIDALNWQHQRGIISLQDSLRGFSAPASANDTRGSTAAVAAARYIPGVKSVGGRP